MVILNTRVKVRLSAVGRGVEAALNVLRSLHVGGNLLVQQLQLEGVFDEARK